MDPVKDLWLALCRAEQEVFGDHLSFGTVEPILRAALNPPGVTKLALNPDATVSVIATLGTPQQPPQAKRVCPMCDCYIWGRHTECPRCGGDTERIPR